MHKKMYKLSGKKLRLYLKVVENILPPEKYRIFEDYYLYNRKYPFWSAPTMFLYIYPLIAIFIFSRDLNKYWWISYARHGITYLLMILSYFFGRNGIDKLNYEFADNLYNRIINDELTADYEITKHSDMYLTSSAKKVYKEYNISIKGNDIALRKIR